MRSDKVGLVGSALSVGDLHLGKKGYAWTRVLPRIARKPTIGGRPAIVPIISSRGWITGVDQYMFGPADAWLSGYRLSDTRPRMREAI
jgi:proline racemase